MNPRSASVRKKSDLSSVMLSEVFAALCRPLPAETLVAFAPGGGRAVPDIFCLGRRNQPRSIERYEPFASLRGLSEQRREGCEVRFRRCRSLDHATYRIELRRGAH